MSNLISIQTKKKIEPFQTNFEIIARKIYDDCIKLKLLNLEPYAVILGHDELAATNDFFKRKNNGLNKINDLIIINIPEKNYCCVVPNGFGAFKLYGNRKAKEGGENETFS